jgi:hypothetical protein
MIQIGNNFMVSSCIRKLDIGVVSSSQNPWPFHGQYRIKKLENDILSCHLRIWEEIGSIKLTAGSLSLFFLIILLIKPPNNNLIDDDMYNNCTSCVSVNLSNLLHHLMLFPEVQMLIYLKKVINMNLTLNLYINSISPCKQI